MATGWRARQGQSGVGAAARRRTEAHGRAERGGSSGLGYLERAGRLERARATPAGPGDSSGPGGLQRARATQAGPDGHQGRRSGTRWYSSVWVLVTSSAQAAQALCWLRQSTQTIWRVAALARPQNAHSASMARAGVRPGGVASRLALVWCWLRQARARVRPAARVRAQRPSAKCLGPAAATPIGAGCGERAADRVRRANSSSTSDGKLPALAASSPIGASCGSTGPDRVQLRIRTQGRAAKCARELRLLRALARPGLRTHGGQWVWPEEPGTVKLEVHTETMGLG